MTVRELITQLMLLDPNLTVVMVDTGAPVENWEDDSNWQGISKVSGPQETTYYGGQSKVLATNAARLEGF